MVQFKRNRIGDFARRRPDPAGDAEFGQGSHHLLVELSHTLRFQCDGDELAVAGLDQEPVIDKINWISTVPLTVPREYGMADVVSPRAVR